MTVPKEHYRECVLLTAQLMAQLNVLQRLESYIGVLPENAVVFIVESLVSKEGELAYLNREIALLESER